MFLSQIIDDIQLDSDPSGGNPIFIAFLERLNRLCDISVSDFLSRFTNLLPLAHPPSFSAAAPTLFTRPDQQDFDLSYELWLLLPVPSPSQLSFLRQQQSEATTAGYNSIQLPRILGVECDVLLPLWMINCWARLHTLQSFGKDWTQGKEWLNEIVRQGTFAASASECVNQLSQIPLDAPLASMPDLSASKLATFLGRNWLSDDHMNAGAERINSHPSCPITSRVVNTHFIGSLALHRQRSAQWSPSHPRLLDTMAADGRLTHLYFALHEESHWTYLRLNLPSLTYEYTDTMSLAVSHAPALVVELLNWWLSSILHKEVSLKPIFRSFAADRQMDSHSCGIAVLTTMAHQVLGPQFHAWTQRSAPLCRIRWFLDFSKCIFPMPSSPTEKATVFDVDPNDFDLVLSDTEQSAHIPNLDILSSFGASPGPSDITSSSSESDISCYGTHADKSPDACIEPGSDPEPKARRILVQTRLPFHTIPRAEYDMQERSRYVKFQEQCRIEQEREAMEKVQVRLAQTTYWRDQKRAQRTARRAAQVEAGIRGLDGKLKKRSIGRDVKHRSGTPQPTSPLAHPTLAEDSRPRRAYRAQEKQARRLRSGQPPSLKPSTSSVRINWANPLLWRQIDCAAKAVGFPWRPVDIINRLRQQDPETFAALRPQRISQWRDLSIHDELKWKECHLQAVERGNSSPTVSSSRSVLSSYPALTAEIKAHLMKLRAAGVALNLGIIRGFMVGMIEHLAPDVFQQINKNGRPYQLSNSSVQRFLRSYLGWSIRRATRAAQKIPSNADEVLRRSFLRMACLIRDEDIPACCIVNTDQTQVVYSAGSGSSWNERGQRQVAILGADEKRAFTLVVGVSMSGDVLPPQAVYTGKSSRSLPDADFVEFAHHRIPGVEFLPSSTTTYWSTLETMQSYVSNILVPYLLNQICTHNLPSAQQCIFQIDCWSVHRSTEFCSWMATNYPWITLQFVPGGCTGLFQACDVGIQRILKLAMRNAAHHDVVQETLRLLDSGVLPSEILNDCTVKTLRNRSVRWILEGFSAINDPDLVQKAFRLCAVPGTRFNLSYESLTSREARAALLELRSSDPAFYAEITMGVASTTQEPAEDLFTNEDLDQEDDPATVTVAELSDALLNASVASHIVAVPSTNDSDEEEDLSDADDDSDDDYKARFSVVAPSTQPRRSARFSGRGH